MALISIGALAAVVVRAEDKPPAPAQTEGAAKGGTAAATAAAAAVDAKKAAVTAVAAAVKKLTDEVQAHKKDPKVSLRAKSNYFIENKSADVTPEEILNAMNRSLATDAASDAYIKWQLLSGIEGKVDVKLASKLLSAYSAAPVLFTRPGLEAGEKHRLDKEIRGLAQNDLAKYNQEFQKQVAETASNNEPIIVYRADVYAHLPGSGEAILAGLEDGAARAGRGIDADKHMKGVLAQITTWSVSASPQEVRSVSGLLRQLVGKMGGSVPKAAADAPEGPFYAGGGRTEIFFAKGKAPASPAAPAKAGFPPSYYSAVEYDDKAKHMMWKEGSAKFADLKTLTAMVLQLDETAASLANMKSK
jgi:hypothetical protein